MAPRADGRPKAKWELVKKLPAFEHRGRVCWEGSLELKHDITYFRYRVVCKACGATTPVRRTIIETSVDIHEDEWVSPLGSALLKDAQRLQYKETKI